MAFTSPEETKPVGRNISQHRRIIPESMCLLMASTTLGRSPRQCDQPLLPTHTVDQRPSTTRRLIFVEETIWTGHPTEAIPLATMQAGLPPVEEVD